MTGRKPHDAHLSPINCYDPGRDPAIGPLADVAVGSASGSLVAAAGNATGLEPSLPLRGEPHIATIVGPADVSTGGGPLALVALAVAGVGSYAGGSAFIVGLTPVALDGQHALPRPQGTNRTSRISACGSAGAASAVKAPTCDVAANRRAAGRPISSASTVSLGRVPTDGPPRDASLPASRTHRSNAHRLGGVLATARACRRGASSIAVGNRAASPFHHGLLVTSVASLDGLDRAASPTRSRTTRRARTTIVPVESPTGAVLPTDATIGRGRAVLPCLWDLLVPGGASLDCPICAASRPADR